MKNYIVGVDIGGTSIKFGLFKKDARLIKKWEYPTNAIDQGKQIIGDIADQIITTLSELNITNDEILGIGFGVPGPVGQDNVIKKCVNLGWENLNLHNEMQQYINTLIRVGNDANVAALGEQSFGAGVGFKNIIMVTLGTGVGGGVVQEGRIVEGKNGSAGEIGHLKVVYQGGEKCNCGKNGCLEKYASASGITTLAKKYSSQEKSIDKVEINDAKSVFDFARQGSTSCQKAINEAANYLGIGLSHISGILDPDVFIIGGGLAQAGDEFLDLIRSKYQSYASFSTDKTDIKSAMLGNDAGIYGAAKLIIQMKEN